MGTKQPDVVGIGSVSWDRFLVVPWLPGPNENVRAIRCEESAGGGVATSLVALVRWGLSCRLVTVLGFDEYARHIEEDLARESILLDDLVRREDADTTKNTVLVDNRNGSHTLIRAPHRSVPLDPATLNPKTLAGARVLHLDTSLEEYAVRAATVAKQAGLYVTLDADAVALGTAELLRRVDYVIAPLSFALEMTEQEEVSRAAYALHLQSGKPVIVTEGSGGCYYQDADRSFHQPAFGVPVVDSTGARDVFHGGFIYGLLAAWDIQKTVRFATWAAAAACREIGGRKGIPTFEAIHQFIRH